MQYFIIKYITFVYITKQKQEDHFDEQYSKFEYINLTNMIFYHDQLLLDCEQIHFYLHRKNFSSDLCSLCSQKGIKLILLLIKLFKKHSALGDNDSLKVHLEYTFIQVVVIVKLSFHA